MQSSYMTRTRGNPPFHLLLYVAHVHCLHVSTIQKVMPRGSHSDSVCRILCSVWGLLARGRAALARLHSSGISVPAELPEAADILHQVSAAIQRSCCVLSRHHPQHRSPNYQCHRFKLHTMYRRRQWQNMLACMAAARHGCADCWLPHLHRCNHYRRIQKTPKSATPLCIGMEQWDIKNVRKRYEVQDRPCPGIACAGTFRRCG